AQAEIGYDIMEGRRCPGCEVPVAEDSGVECYCAAEDFGRTHELYKWCTQRCFDATHEDCHPMPQEVEC
ncbi:hypothetical protein LCGC14_2835400, partial [marine sediment metagenome]